jgi:hypothetical protein
MKEKELKKLVDTAVALHREIGGKTEQLKRIKLRLIEEARRHPEALTLTETGGTRWTADGTDGCITERFGRFEPTWAKTPGFGGRKSGGIN